MLPGPLPAIVDHAAFRTAFHATLGDKGPFQWSLLVGGRSNLTLRAVSSASDVVLRMPPTGKGLDRAHDVAREHRIVAALTSSALPLATVRGTFTSDVEGVTIPVALYDFVPGDVLHVESDGERIQASDRYALGMDAIAVLAALHSVDPNAVGLSDLGKPDGYVERQLARWSKQWQAQSDRVLTDWVEVGERIRACNLEAQRVSIAHGDFRLGNLIVANGRVAAVLDWELCTLGDPLADLGYFTMSFRTQADAPIPLPAPSRTPGFPSRKDLCARYERDTKLDLSQLHAYQALSLFRLCAIVEGVRMRELARGKTEEAVTLRSSVDALAQLALGCFDASYTV
jgi:aminoglycoside phosphotransferase (APT) family kinase protein